jgi:hypothetical protein
MTDIDNKPETEHEQPNEVIELTKSESEKQIENIEQKMKKPRKKRKPVPCLSPEEIRINKIEHNKKYYRKNKDFLLDFEKECVCCNHVYKRHAWSHHVKTQKHQRNLQKFQAA